MWLHLTSECEPLDWAINGDMGHYSTSSPQVSYPDCGYFFLVHKFFTIRRGKLCLASWVGGFILTHSPDEAVNLTCGCTTSVAFSHPFFGWTLSHCSCHWGSTLRILQIANTATIRWAIPILSFCKTNMDCESLNQLGMTILMPYEFAIDISFMK